MTNHGIVFCLLVAVVAIQAFPQYASDLDTDSVQNIENKDFKDAPMETILEVEGDRTKRFADPQYGYGDYGGGYGGYGGGYGGGYDGGYGRGYGGGGGYGGYGGGGHRGGHGHHHRGGYYG